MDPLSPRSFSLWFGVLAPPLAWGAHLVLGDLLFELGCSRGVGGAHLLGVPQEGWAVIETVLAAGISVVAGALALGAFRRLRRLPDGTAWGRAHALAIAGIATSAVYLLIIAYGFLAPFILDRCATSP